MDDTVEKIIKESSEPVIEEGEFTIEPVMDEKIIKESSEPVIENLDVYDKIRKAKITSKNKYSPENFIKLDDTPFAKTQICHNFLVDGKCFNYEINKPCIYSHNYHKIIPKRCWIVNCSPPLCKFLHINETRREYLSKLRQIIILEREKRDKENKLYYEKREKFHKELRKRQNRETEVYSERQNRETEVYSERRNRETEVYSERRNREMEVYSERKRRNREMEVYSERKRRNSKSRERETDSSKEINITVSRDSAMDVFKNLLYTGATQITFNIK
jgi:hypothetical protein